jgi:hypothetical protein
MDISQYGLTSATATAAHVHANPLKYGTTTEGMLCESMLRRQLGTRRLTLLLMLAFVLAEIE